MTDTAAAELTVTPDGSFSLAAAASFGFGPNTGRPKPDGNSMSLAFVADDLEHHAAAFVTQDAEGVLHCRIFGEAEPDIVLSQLRRVLSLDQSGTAWAAVGGRDPVIGRLQAEFPGLRPVLFHSPYEAAAWSILSQRRHRTQATAVRRRLSAAHGHVFSLPGGELEAFPTPRALLAVDGFPSIEPQRIQRLHAIARAALDGQLDPGRLLALAPEQAMAELQELPGIGPTYATLILLRSTGATDILTLGEPRIPSYVRHFYGMAGPAAPAEISSLAEAWRPFRTWACVLIRVAGDREGVALEPQPGGGR
ncbi:MAG: DNA-3-methyladenine glycosylase 2 family protein [Candidatus Dormiibacterota bacterium]